MQIVCIMACMQKVSDHEVVSTSCPGYFHPSSLFLECWAHSGLYCHTAVMRDLIILEHQEEPLCVSAIAYITVRVDQFLDTKSQIMCDFCPFGT